MLPDDVLVEGRIDEGFQAGETAGVIANLLSRLPLPQPPPLGCGGWSGMT